jgi:polyisoprenoid-binding protein YceI
MTTLWTIDHSHSGIHFTVRHLMVSKVRGTFAKWTGELALDDADMTKSRVDVTIDAASIFTDEAKRDAHLRSADFFEVEKYPHLTFKSTKVEKTDADTLAVTGELTIRDVTKTVVLEVTDNGRVKDPWGGTRAGFSAHLSLSRKEYGLTWNALLEAGGVAVSDKIEIGLEIEAIAPAAIAAA